MEKDVDPSGIALPTPNKAVRETKAKFPEALDSKETVTDIHPYDFYDLLNNLPEGYSLMVRQDGLIEVTKVYRQTSTAEVSPECSLRSEPIWEELFKKEETWRGKNLT